MNSRASRIETGMTLTARLICDSDILLLATVIERKGNFATVDYDGKIIRKKIFVGRDGNDFMYLDGKYSMCPVFHGENVGLGDQPLFMDLVETKCGSQFFVATSNVYGKITSKIMLESNGKVISNIRYKGDLKEIHDNVVNGIKSQYVRVETNSLGDTDYYFDKKPFLRLVS